MKNNMGMFTIDALFDVRSGDFHATKDLDPGRTPLVSCGNTNNGIMGYYDIPPENIYRRAITVAYNGSWPLMSKFHPYAFGAKDDVAVLIPRTEQRREVLIYAAAMLNRLTWRYSYGRKCFRQKLQNVEIPMPVVKGGKGASIDEALICRLHSAALDRVLARMTASIDEWKEATQT